MTYTPEKTFMPISKIFFALLCFLLFSYSKTWAQWNLYTSEAYQAILKWDLEKADRALEKGQLFSETPENQYIVLYLQNFSEAIRTAQNSTHEDWKKFETEKNERLKTIEENKTDSPYFLYCQAEIHLQAAFVALLANEQYNAAQSLKRAYKLLEMNELAFPKFLPTQKSLSIIRILLDFVPKKHHWLLNLLGLKGDWEKGINNLLVLAYSEEFCHVEAKITYALLQVYLLQKPEEAWLFLNQSLGNLNYSHRSVYFVRGLVALKAGNVEKAYQELGKIPPDENGLTLPFVNYLKGETLLLKGDYSKSIGFYQDFLAQYKGKNYLKDSFYKIFLNYWFLDDPRSAVYRQLIKYRGANISAPDRHAQAFAEYPKLPNKKLTQIRLFCDGFQFAKASELIGSVFEKELETEKDKLEYYYRKARIEHGLENWEKAILFYEQTITKAEQKPYYFAPNACLQLGLIYETVQKDLPKAKIYYQKVLTYGEHEYKESLDTKAETALKRLGF